MTVYLCWIALLEQGANDSKATIRVREAGDASPSSSSVKPLASDADLDRLQDRVEALGGRLTNEPEPGGGTRVSGPLPLRR